MSSRDLVQMMAERGIVRAHTTVLRWVQRYVPDFSCSAPGGAADERAPFLTQIKATAWRQRLRVRDRGPTIIRTKTYAKRRRPRRMRPEGWDQGISTQRNPKRILPAALENFRKLRFNRLW